MGRGSSAASGRPPPDGQTSAPPRRRFAVPPIRTHRTHARRGPGRFVRLRQAAKATGYGHRQGRNRARRTGVLGEQPSWGGPWAIRPRSVQNWYFSSLVTISRPVQGRSTAWAETTYWARLPRPFYTPRALALSCLSPRRRYARCRGLRRALRRRRALTRYSHPSLPCLLCETEHPLT